MLEGKKILITAGPTYESIDPVRFIGNRSSGKMGYFIAEKVAEMGARVILISGPVSINISHPLIDVYNIETAKEMFDLAVLNFPSCDGAILVAAVADFTPIEKSDIKIKKKENQEELVIHLKKTDDILGYLGKTKTENQKLVGFSLETHDELENATQKLKNKNLDFIVLNSLNDKGAGFGYDTNKITIIKSDGELTSFSLKSKKEVAEDIVTLFANLYNQ